MHPTLEPADSRRAVDGYRAGGLTAQGWTSIARLHLSGADPTDLRDAALRAHAAFIREVTLQVGSRAYRGEMGIDVRPASLERFDDVRTMLGPKNPESSVCWCLSHRVPAKLNRELVGEARADHVRTLCSREVAPGVLAYDGDVVVGWAAVAPRAGLPFARSAKFPHVDDQAVWSAWCLRVRPGHRGKGVVHELLRGAVDYALTQGAPAVEGYPVENDGRKVDLTMAYVGTRAIFERAGFVKVADTQAVSGGFPRVLMRWRG